MRATDLIIVLHGTRRLYRPCTGRRIEWPIQEFNASLFIALVHQLLDPSEPEPSATEDLSYGHLIAWHAGTGGRARCN